MFTCIYQQINKTYDMKDSLNLSKQTILPHICLQAIFNNISQRKLKERRRKRTILFSFKYSIIYDDVTLYKLVD